ncbi:hypothetical protein [Brevundimonas sp.]|uniref:hypothetical protein n=1 Tax=Brevundimonas sp. TaxID=1871086 RepID=UPI002D3C9E50|nr:hypothetical protein [Brevundimonas sp.]HYD26921.1 hypothetical protein [Brevundimonas sp.]
MAAPLTLEAMRYLAQVRVTPNSLGVFPDLHALAERFAVTGGEMNLVLDALQRRTPEEAYASLCERLGLPAEPRPAGLGGFLRSKFGGAS